MHNYGLHDVITIYSAPSRVRVYEYVCLHDAFAQVFTINARGSCTIFIFFLFIFFRLAAVTCCCSTRVKCTGPVAVTRHARPAATARSFKFSRARMVFTNENVMRAADTSNTVFDFSSNYEAKKKTIIQKHIL